MHEAPSASNRGQASVFKAPRVLAAIQAQEGTPGSDTQATVTPIIAGTEDGRGDEAEELEGSSSEQMRPSEIIDVADSLSTDVGGSMFVAGEEQVENEDQAERFLSSAMKSPHKNYFFMRCREYVVVLFQPFVAF